MFSLARFFGKEDRFFELLEASAEEARHSVQAMVKLAKNAGQPGSLEEFSASRRKDKQITQEISEALTTTFVTSLEREDIETLSNALYKIPKTAEKFSEKFLLCRQALQVVDFSRQISLLEKAVQTVVEMVQKLRQRKHLESMKEQIGRLHYVEGEADKLMLELVRELYSGKYEPLQVIITMDLYETLEKIIDRCRDAGNVIFQIVLKYS